jgi:hypothetical protein
MSRIIETASGELYRVVLRLSDDGTHSFEEIEPVTSLASRAGITGNADISRDLVARAEAVAKSLSEQYPALAQADLAELRACGAKLTAGKTASSVQESADALVSAARKLEGQGGSFGFPLVTAIAASLCCLLTQSDLFHPSVTKIAAAHIDALTLVINNAIADSEDPAGKHLTSEIITMTSRLLGRSKI